LNDAPYEVTAVMPPAFKFPPPIKLEGSEAPSNAEIWVPYGELNNGQRGAHHLVTVARLKPGVTPETAAAEMKSIQAQLAEEYPASNGHWTGTVIPLDAQVLGDVKTPLVVLMGAVAFVLLIACVNVANLLLARAADRRKEFAIRAALGAGAARLARQLLAESFILAAAGGALGLLLAVWGMDALLQLAPANIPRLDDVSLDWRVAVFALAISIFTGVLFGLAPLAQGVSPQLSQSLREGGRTSSGAGGGARLRSALVVAEVALSLVLLVGAGLMLETFRQLRGTDAGFRPGNVVTLRLTLPAGRYTDRAQMSPAFTEIEQRINALPQVERAGFVLELPLAGDRQGTSFEIEGDPPEGPETRRQIGFTYVTPQYFPAMGVSILAGRNLSEADTAGAPSVLVVNQAFVNRYFPDGNVVGKRIFPGSRTQALHEIVGVVSDVRHVDLREAAPPTVYMPVAQFAWSRSMSLVARARPHQTDAAAAALAAVREEIAAFDRNIPIYDVQTLDEVLAGAVATPRFSSLLLGMFSALALVLAGIGIYGVVSYGVSRRTHELGVRMALGAQPGDVLRLVLREGAGLAVAGMAAGIVAALALTRALAGLLYGVSTTDAFTYVVVCATLLGVTLLACWLPARRASRVDPMVALRYE
ncbi:MAG TPA: ABC transporter permease, partial [Candidatus Acidoferrales bacterium]